LWRTAGTISAIKSLIDVFQSSEVLYMLSFLLQLWGGSFYLLNKLFFSRAERAVDHRNQQKWQRRAWAAYLFGVPPWVFIFISEHNWIAAAVESSGIPAMLIGLIAARHGHDRLPGYAGLDHLARLMIISGLALSFWDFGGLATLNQVLELGVAAGFLFGTYFLAKLRLCGYAWLIVGNVSAASLMMRQGYVLLMTQQLLSLGLVLDAFRTRRQKAGENTENMHKG
jgi:hypothetical protein